MTWLETNPHNWKSLKNGPNGNSKSMLFLGKNITVGPDARPLLVHGYIFHPLLELAEHKQTLPGLYLTMGIIVYRVSQEE